MNSTIKKSLFVATGMIAAVGLNSYMIRQNNQATDKLKEKVLTTDSTRYNRITNDISKGKKANTYYNWAKEVQKMNDSIKVDSIAKTAYAKGAQMVRDSIKVASKVK